MFNFVEKRKDFRQKASRRSLLISLVAVFASLHTILGLIPGIWRSWIIALEPLEGIVLGPIGGFLAALIGTLLSRFIRPRVAVMYFFGLGEPLGALTAGLIFKGKHYQVLAIYTIMLAAYFLHPLGRTLPAWCLWDVYAACALIVISLLLWKTVENRKPLKLFLTSFIGIEADVLWRIFLFIPLEFYKALGFSEEALPVIWIAGAFETPVETAISVVVTLTVGLPLLKAIEKSKLINYPVT